jgi:hypothetical protein
MDLSIDFRHVSQVKFFAAAFLPIAGVANRFGAHRLSTKIGSRSGAFSGLSHHLRWRKSRLIFNVSFTKFNLYLTQEAHNLQKIHKISLDRITQTRYSEGHAGTVKMGN